MKTKQLLSKYLFGLTIPQQYICLALENLSNPMKVMLTSRQSRVCISVSPVFVGYKPVVFALNDASYNLKDGEYCLNFYQHSDFQTNSKWMNFFVDRNSVAFMAVHVLPIRFKFLPGLTLLKGELIKHTFISEMHAKINSLRERFVKNRPGNVDLPGHLLNMVRTAYSIPRVIALISISDGRRMNLFPTDLHGQLDDNFYISSLRIGGKAEQQVREIGKIVLCEIDSESFNESYKLGKNHMKEFSSPSEFNLSSAVSEKFGFPLPSQVLRYFELKLLEFVDEGIHRIFVYKIENRVSMRSGKTLSHIHQYYAEWRRRNGMKTDLLLR